MAKSVARGKALVAKLRADPTVRDAEALAAYLGRFKKLRKAGNSVKKAAKLAKGGSSSNSGSRRHGGGSLAERLGREGASRPKSAEKRSSIFGKPPDDNDDPFNEDFGENEKKSKEDEQRERQEAALIARMEKEERSRLYNVFQEVGGLKTREDLREEYRAIPNNLKRRDGLPGDEMAEYLATYYPEFGIESENDLLDFFAPSYGYAA